MTSSSLSPPSRPKAFLHFFMGKPGLLVARAFQLENRKTLKTGKKPGDDADLFRLCLQEVAGVGC